MEKHYNYFMLVAEKLNMSDVARDTFVSHQCISTHIKQLEDKLKIKLFKRRPKLSLTKEGETLLYALQQIRIIEDSCIAELTEGNKDSHGKICIGIPSSRHSILVPMLLPKFKNMYPNVEVEIISDFSHMLEIRAMNGDIDLFIGMGQAETTNLTSIRLVEESFYILISDFLMKKFFSTSYPCCVTKFQRGVDIKDFKHVPFILTPPPSRLRRTVDLLSAENNFKLNIVFQTNSIEIFAHLCQEHMGACIASQMFFPSLKLLNSNTSSEKYIHAFPIKNLLDYCNSIYIAYNKQKYTPAYLKDFIKLTRMVFDGYPWEPIPKIV